LAHGTPCTNLLKPRTFLNTAVPVSTTYTNLVYMIHPTSTVVTTLPVRNSQMAREVGHTPITKKNKIKIHLVIGFRNCHFFSLFIDSRLTFGFSHLSLHVNDLGVVRVRNHYTTKKSMRPVLGTKTVIYRSLRFPAVMR